MEESTTLLKINGHNHLHHDQMSVQRSNSMPNLENERMEESKYVLRSEFDEVKRDRDELEEKLWEEVKEKEEIRVELEVYKGKKIEAFEVEESEEILIGMWNSIGLVKRVLWEEVVDCCDDVSVIERDGDDGVRDLVGLYEEIKCIEGLVKEVKKKESEDLLIGIRDLIGVVKRGLLGVLDLLDNERVIEKEGNEVRDLGSLHEEIKRVEDLVKEVEGGVREANAAKEKEKKELENSVVSLTEENRDINNLLRVALVEKEAVERNLNRLRGGGSEKRVALLQFAERGLQRVGFGFMMGSGGSSEHQAGEISSAASNKSDSSDCDEEVVSLASTVEKIMKNLRNEIIQLRKSLDESRSDTERLQSLTEKQAKTLEENALYIRELEDRERVLAENVEELLLEIKATEEEVARWREACELEVEAGKKEMEERDKLITQYLDSTLSFYKVDILTKELEKTKAALNIANSKLKLKEDLAAAAMAAQAAAEKSLQIADTRAAELRERIEDLTKQLEEIERKEMSRLKIRHICWPWRAFRFNAANNTNTRFQTIRRMLPEMQSLIQYRT